ncbi:HlyC/CorC family transporter [Occultella glacieicola]|uniref:HlyC/CorC family transporter n=1 Tax=Occultella glacieicola TaxID=2518684 RepID=A0ABY2DZ48_9MICO|nr:hemolysin family protein [Occultella glacieicola]TDE89959.1 HlyC/CorC family transporter [Occultella glacieicola]
MTDAGPLPLLILLALAGAGLAALLSAGQAAAGRITRAAAHEAQTAGTRGAAHVVRIAENPAGVTRAAGFTQILAEMMAAVCLTLILAGAVRSWWAVLVLSVVLCALVMVIVVGISPRTIGRRDPVRVLAWVGPLLLALATLYGPMVRLADSLGARAGRTTSEEREAGEEDLRDMVDRVSESHQIDDDEREMLHSVFELGRTMVREVMVPRTDMVTVASGTPMQKAITLFVRSGYSRVPVVGDSVDDLLGVLYLKDALRYVTKKPERSTAPVDRVMRGAVFVPETKPVDDLLDEMRDAVVHIAIVFDEYGGIAGLITIEDILEELVGELVDEHDASEMEVVPDGDGTFVVPARLPLDELGDLFGLEVTDDEVDTVGGLLAKALGKVPIAGARAVTHGVQIRALDATGRRKQITTLRVRAAQPAPADGGEHPEPAGNADQAPDPEHPGRSPHEPADEGHRS